MFSAGTITSSIMMAPVTEARRLNLPSILGVVRPFMLRSRMKPRMAPPSSVLQITSTSAIGELVIHILDPEPLYPPRTVTALLFMPPGWQPCSHSVSAKQPTHSPVARLGREFLRHSSHP